MATATLDAGTAISESDAFSVFAIQYFAIATFTGRHAELFPMIEQATVENPDLLTTRLAFGVLCSAVGRQADSRTILEDLVATGFSTISFDSLRTTNFTSCCVMAIELQHVDAARALLPLIEPFAAEVSFNGASSLGPIAAYVGKLAMLVGDLDLAEARLLQALRITEAFGWTYHRATTRFSMAEARFRRLGRLDADGRGWLDEATALCAAGGCAIWSAKIEALEGELERVGAPGPPTTG